MTAALGELASLVGGHVEGDAQVVIRGANPISQVCPGEITLIDSAARSKDLLASPAAAVVLDAALELNPPIPCLRVADPHSAFAQIVRRFCPARPTPVPAIHPQAVISATARIASGASIGAFCTVEDDVVLGARATLHPGVHLGPGVVLGDDVTLFPGVVLYADVVVGDRVTIHAGTVVGGHGFGYRFENGRHVPAAQLGNVIIGNDVEIGAQVTIDRGTYGATRIGDGTKIDNLVQIAHNCELGRHNLICSQVGIAGSTTTGDGVVMAGQVGVRDHVHIGEGAVLTAMAGVSNDVPAGTTMMGVPATPMREQKLKQAALAKLVEMRREFKRAQRRIESLSRQIEALENPPAGSPTGDRAA